MRGFKKHVHKAKGTDSEIFGEAVFFLREDASQPKKNGDIISEANRIIEDSLGYRPCGMDGRKNAFLRKSLPFLIGALSLVAVVLLIALFH